MRPSRFAMARTLSVAFVALAAGIAGTATFPAARADATTGQAVVRVDSGPLRGVVTADHRSFAGIPYAAPPVGARRWSAPQPVTRWRQVRDATRPGTSCPQLGPGGSVVGAEDCLYLNVTTPTVGGSRLPVLVWLPGGGFVTGSGSDYDPTRLAVTGGLVVVTVNYRLGALGFLDHPALERTSSDAGNYGLADQRAALGWVQRNIARFGGDPANVTLAGQSAGGYSVCAQLTSPAAAGLFQKAIVQSGPCGNALLTRATALSRGARTAAELGCADPATASACLRALPVSRLVGLGADRVFTSTGRIADLPWVPVAGTPVLPRQPLEALRSGAAARVPLLMGTTRDEMRPFVALDHDAHGLPVTAESYPAELAAAFGDPAAIQARYPSDAYPSPGLALATALTDWGGKLGSCPSLAAADAAVAGMRHPVHVYEFTEDGGARIAGFPLGAPHGAELPYLFDGSFDGPGNPELTPAQQRLARWMIAYWSTFAATGDPDGDRDNAIGGGTGPRWPAYRGDGRVLALASGPDGTAVVDAGQAHHCPFWWSKANP
ncbi:carboxylesterase/lipase family protein [Actinopolymorpha singaporensis]